MLDVCTPSEDPLQVDPPPLNINPHVEEGIDPVEPVLPGHGVIFKHFEVGRELHGGHRVDVLLDLVEEVVPTSDKAALILIVDQVQFIVLP